MLRIKATLLFVIFFGSGAAADVLRPTEAMVDRAKKNIGAMLRDPYTARYTIFYATKRPNGEDTAICGAVNAKNMYGGYVGDRNFYYVEGASIRAAIINESSQFDSLMFWSHCTEAAELRSNDPADRGAACGPETSIESEGHCGALYAKCLQEASGAPLIGRFALVQQCRRSGSPDPNSK